MRLEVLHPIRRAAHALGAVALLLTVSVPSYAIDTRGSSWERPYEDAEKAAPPPPRFSSKKHGQRSFGALLNLGAWQGFGLGLQFGASRAGVRISGGWEPVFVEYTPPSAFRSTTTVFSTWLLSTDAYLNMFEATDRGRAGPLIGYRYNSLLGHGLALGGWGGLRLGSEGDLLFQGGVMAFPKGADRVRQDGAIVEGSTFGLLSPGVVIGLGLSLALFP